MNQNKTYNIPGRLHSIGSEGIVAGADEILDDELNLKQNEINAITGTHIANDEIHVTAAEKEYWNSKVNPPSYSAPTAKQLTYTGEAQDLLNPGSSTIGNIQYSTDETNWSTIVPQETNAGTYTVYWRFVGSELVYIDSTEITVTIAKANPTYTAPTAKTLTYNGNAQELVNAGTTNDGTIKYSFDGINWIDPYNGYDFVDLGLPSGTKWATMNVGASTPEDYGNYYMYGKGANVYNSSDSYYNGTENPLSLDVDTARQAWGGQWHMPTIDQIEEIRRNCTLQNITINNIACVKVCSTTNSNYIILPKGGQWNNGTQYALNTYGFYWSSSASDAPFLAKGFSSLFESDNEARTNGRTIRGVVDDNVSSIPQGTDADTYTVYWKLMGDANHNDVASTAISVSIAKVTPTVVAPTAKTGLVYDGTAHELVNAGSTDFGTLQYSLDNEAYSTSIPNGTNAGDYTVYYKFIGDSNVNDVAAQSVSCSIAKVTPTYTAPTAKRLDYTGSAQNLLDAGTTDVGTMQYSLDNVSWSTSIPQGTAVGAYTCYWRILGNANIDDVAASSLESKIESGHMGHEYVDLGLPSGTKWATKNVGASNINDYGNYYMYGKGAKQYNGQDRTDLGYTGTENPLSLTVDTARQVMGGNWHMPTRTQFTELINNTTYSRVTNYNNSGKVADVFTSKINGKQIIFPEAGYYWYGYGTNDVGDYALHETEQTCNIFTSTPTAYHSTGEECYFFTCGYKSDGYGKVKPQVRVGNARNPISIRGVIG